MKHIRLALVLVLATAGTASAGGIPGSIGVGAELELSDADVGGISVNYDAGKFHVGGFLGFSDPDGNDNDKFNIGGRFFYHVATTASSDFGIGGGLGIQSAASGNGRKTGLFLEPGFQIRVFIVPNVALSFTGGISVGTIDAHDVVISGDFAGTAGVHYYF